jgi:RHS repeat-associated protein
VSINNRTKQHSAHWFMCLSFALSVALTNTASAQTMADINYHDDLHERLQVQKEIEPLPDNLAGESIDYFSGNVGFSVTDISIPGNFAIPVQIKRSLSRQVDAVTDFADWELEVPRITGVYGSSSHMDCQEPEPPAIMSDNGVTPLGWQKFHRGLTLSDGEGYSEQLIPIDTLLTPPYLMPAGYDYYTKSHWLIRCSSANYIAVSPSGVTYTFGNKRFGYDKNEICANGNELCINTLTVISRASTVEDRFGNSVTYTYNTEDNLTSITASDGRSIKLYYSDSEYHRIERVEANGRQWQYEYTDGRFSEDLLTRVILPDNTEWQYKLYDEGCEGPCDSNPEHLPESYRHIRELNRNLPYFGNPYRSETFRFTVRHPEGANIEFTFDDIYLHRFKAGFKVDSRSGGTAGKCTHISCIGKLTSLALSKKTIQYDTSNTYQWVFDYSESSRLVYIFTPDGDPVNEAATRQTTTITSPDNITEIVYHRIADIYEGAELWRAVKTLDGSEIYRTTNDWQKGKYYGDIFLTTEPNTYSTIKGVNVARRAFSTRLVNTTSNADGSQFHKIYSDFNDYEVAQKVYQYNDFSTDQLYTRQDYYQDITNWILNLPTKKSISDNDTNYSVTSENTYYPATHTYKSLLNNTIAFNQWITRITQYYSDGNPRRIEFNEPLLTAGGAPTSQYRFKEYGDYKRGKPQAIVYASRYSDTARISAAQQVDDNGWVTLIRDLNAHTTRYAYDSIGHLIAIDLPDTWIDTVIDWQTSSNGSRRVHTHRCDLLADNSGCNGPISATETIDYDYLLRPSQITKTEVNKGEQRFQTFSYNAANQVLFESYWSADSQYDEGTYYTYDAKQRVTSVEKFGGGTSTTEYLAGNKVRTTNARGHSTTSTYLAYGEPSFNQPKLIEAPEDVNTQQTINVFGEITAVTQTGRGKNGIGTVTQTENRAYDDNHKLCKVRRNDIGQTVYHYSVLGELQWMAQGTGGGTTTDCVSNANDAEKVFITYDNLGGSQSVNYPDSSPDIIYTRDGVGNIIQLDTDSSTQTYGYNSLNLLDYETLGVDGRVLPLIYDYNTLGQTKSITYPDLTKVYYTRNSFDEITQINSDTELFAFNATYFPSGNIDTFFYGNSVKHDVDLNSRRLPETIQEQINDSPVLHYGYQYDDEGNITQLIDYVDNNYTINSLSYDGLNRLTGTNGNSGIGSSTIHYDGLGNITGYNNKKYSLDYHYDTPNNRLDSITGSKNYNFQYSDNRGNVTHNGTRAFTYNRANQLTESGDNKYVYDGLNKRIKTQDSHGTSYEFYNRAEQIMYREVNGGGINYIYLDKKLIAKQVDSSHDNSGTGYRHYQPYGETLEAQPDGIGYAGHKFDSDLSLSYMQARYYDPVVGRFYSNDPVKFNSANPTSFNRYAYANNNPYKYTDPNGEYADLVLEAVSLALGARSLSQNLQNGNYGAAAVDAVGIAIDTALAAVPGVPGVAGAAIQGSRKGSNIIQGTAQNTKKAGVDTTHAPTSERIANEFVESGDYSSVHLNQAASTITDGASSSLVRPDAAGVRKDNGKIDAVEVLSPGQRATQMENKIKGAMGDQLNSVRSVAPD